MRKTLGSMGVFVVVFFTIMFLAGSSYGEPINLYCDPLGCIVDEAELCNSLSATLNYSQIQNCTTPGDILKWNSGWTCAQDNAGITYTEGTGISIESNQISVSGDVALLSGTQTFTGTKTFSNNITAPQVISNISTGTAPLQVSSTTMVDNFNAEMVGGKSVADLTTDFDSRYGVTPTSFSVSGRTVINTIDGPDNVGQYLSMTIGVDGFPVISYCDNTNWDLKFAKCGDASCTPASVIINTIDSTNNLGSFTSIAIGTDGFPVISYYYATGSDLRVAKCGDASCTPASVTVNSVDTTGAVGSHTSITIGSDGFPVIAYHAGGPNYDLKVAKCEDAACTPASVIRNTVDSAGYVGEYTSITIGTDGFPVISYQDGNPNYDLKVAKCGDVSCTPASVTVNTIDSAGAVGSTNSIAIGTDGFPVISYFDGTPNLDLKVAKCGDASCTPASITFNTVDSAGDLGQFTSITIGTDGFPVISYCDSTNFDLKVAKCGDAACTPASATLTTVDSAENVGYNTSITIGTDGFPVISYRDTTNFDLKVAKCNNAYCVSNWGRR